VHAGVLLAALGHPEARAAFEGAATLARTPVQRFMARHRLAAAEIKRFGRPAEGLVLLDEVDHEVDSAGSTGAISAGDRRTLHSVTANLRALGLIRLGRSTEVRGEITRSLGLHTLDDLREVDTDEAARYGAQERINLAQVLGRDGDLSGAVEHLAENVARCRATGPDYLGEALTALAYAQLRASDWSAAVVAASEAARRIAFEASPSRLRAAREILIAAHARAGEDEQARTVLHACEQDPLGLTLSRPGRTSGPAA
jgi:MoxR-like ATPase